MKKITLAIISVCVLAGLTYAASELSDNNKRYSWRYKMTVEIDTPEGVKSGSAVREVSMVFEPRPHNPSRPYHSTIDVKGEAVVINLGQRGAVFAIIRSGAYAAVTRTIAGPPPGMIEGAEFYSSLEIGTKAQMESKRYPDLCTFTDLNDPLSVKLVKGGRFSVEAQKYLMEDNFEELFGDGVSLKSISVEITDESVTWGIDEVLPWLTALKKNKARLNGSNSVAVFTNELTDNLGAGNFKIGDYK